MYIILRKKYISIYIFCLYTSIIPFLDPECGDETLCFTKMCVFYLSVNTFLFSKHTPILFFLKYVKRRKIFAQ